MGVGMAVKFKRAGIAGSQHAQRIITKSVWPASMAVLLAWWLRQAGNGVGALTGMRA